VDIEKEPLNTAKVLAKRLGVANRIHTICTDTFPLKLLHRPFDLVIAKDIIEHISKDQAFLCNLAMCQPLGGQIILSTQNSLSLNYFLEGTYHRLYLGDKTWAGWDPTHYRFYTPVRINRLLSTAGYTIANWKSVYIIPYNIISWLFFLKRRIYLNSLHRIDLFLGGIFPFNRIGWNLIVSAKLQSHPHRIRAF
jgi:2-polyprenyl-6-hydroxyphenyl methylase/3-demethylubiquinone-9 3-methyltransferase